MKHPRKSTRFELRRETIRQLSEMDLDRAIGAGGAVAYDTGEVTCPTTRAGIVATVGCH